MWLASLNIFALFIIWLKNKMMSFSKKTIIFLHGSGLSHIVWSLTEQFFSNKNFNVLSIDLPGHGNSEGPCLKTIEEIAEWLETFFSKLKLEKINLAELESGN